jgi:hypothetical protein
MFVLMLLGFVATSFIYHDHALRRRRDGAHRRESVRRTQSSVSKSQDSRHADPHRHARCCIPEGIQ